ncbi:sigma-54 interaction domain-containing protein [Fusibacter ferrireducens]|uniref:Sigma 54-interacting transcriptional regulator n=1 Tax=Fusibacter ferrireducens TaxID=2785058 RepID=A0ABR9ZW07_9FIRM|nr:sigma 54-interacting transcriptional regulator [Fusibacter ferrireducens]MBF4694647.1 sigma 54-interacting transcriptional regulator [Fusibacter ferrireducens]
METVNLNEDCGHILGHGDISRVILDAIYDGVLIIDKNAVVQYINPAYTRITGVKYDEIVGNDILSVRPGARLPNVIASGEKVLRALRMEDGVEYMVNMSPILSKGEVIGGISLVKAIGDVYELSNEISHYKKEINILRKQMNAIQKAKYTYDDIVAEDPSSLRTKALAKKIAQKDTTVLISGESGTGKELYAQAIHNDSPRREGPFIVINCATMSHNLLESELFGYSEGSFTGATKEGKIGLFEAANTGTIFLDEISEMDISLQSKLLRTIQESTVRRIGSVKEIPIDVRVIVATNKDLETLVQEGLFKEDLYYRIAVFPIELTPLRARKGDIYPLIKMALKRKANEAKRRIDLTDEALKMLCNYNWPGNIRELVNAIEFAYNMMTDFEIDYTHLPSRIQKYYLEHHAENLKFEKLAVTLKNAEIKSIQNALDLFGHDMEGKRLAAEALGISLATLYNKLKNISK